MSGEGNLFGGLDNVKIGTNLRQLAYDKRANRTRYIRIY